MSARFSCPAGSVQFRTSPHYPDGTWGCLNPANRTPGGVILPGDFLVRNHILDLTWPRAGRAEKDMLENFFWNTALGMAVPFDYTDPAGDTVGVRFADPEVDILCLPGEIYQISTRLALMENWLITNTGDRLTDGEDTIVWG
jgi:hypothetical protein